jgi:hypothetical protein
MNAIENLCSLYVISRAPSQDQLEKKRKNTKIIKSETWHAQELIPVLGQMVKTTDIKDISRATIKSNMQTSAIHTPKKK